MKKIFLLAFLFLVAVNVFAAGTVTPSISKSRDNNSVTVTLSWTASSSDGTLTAYDLTDATMYSISGYYLSSVYVDPGGTAPTAAYDIAINNADSYDVMGGALADLSASASAMLFPPTASPQVIGPLTFVLTNNSVHSATGLVRLYFSKYPTTGTTSATVAGSVTANAGTNLNTSALALETGGNLATLVTSLGKLTIAPGTALGSNTFTMTGGSVTTAAPTYTTGQINPFSLTVKGGLRVTWIDGSGSETGLAATPMYVAPATAGFGVTTTNLDLAQGAAIASKTGPMVQGSVTTAAPTYSNATINPLSMNVKGGTRVTLMTEAGAEVDVATQTTLAALLTYLQTGDTTYNFISTASANLTNVKASAGVLHSLTVFNPGATVQYLRLYDKATAPDPSACSANSDCPVAYYPIPANGDSLVAGFSIPLGIYGKAFANGIGYSISGAACTVRSTCTDETNSAAGVVIDMSYK